jgi:hypothetical protein
MGEYSLKKSRTRTMREPGSIDRTHDRFGVDIKPMNEIEQQVKDAKDLTTVCNGE